MLLLLILFLIIIIFGIFFIFKYKKKKKLSKYTKISFIVKNKRIKFNTSLKESIIDYDKLYHKIFLELLYKGTFGEILKSKPIEIRNINKIWELHKLRNKLVHDFDNISKIVLSKKKLEYEREINVLLR